MKNKPDDCQPLSYRVRRYTRGIAVAVTLTLAALLFLYATLYGEARTDAYAEPRSGPSSQVEETGSLGASGASH
jgi:hypothetical protein